MKSINLEGQTFGKLFVVEFLGYKNRHGWWKCKCECGNIKEVSTSALRRNKNGIKSCGCLKIKPNREQSPYWKGYGIISGKYFSTIKRNAISRKLEFNITIEYINELFEKQNKRCALTNLLLTPNLRHNDNSGTMSLDRIDPELGYTQKNIQWVHKDINFMKQSLSQQQFINYCELVYNNKKEKYETT